MRNRFKKLRGVIRFDNDDIPDSPYLAALTNPDLMSDEMAMYPERDFDGEEARAQYLERVKMALDTLTPKQQAVIDALQKYDTQEKAAAALGIARQTLSVTLLQIQKKISKFISKLENER